MKKYFIFRKLFQILHKVEMINPSKIIINNP